MADVLDYGRNGAGPTLKWLLEKFLLQRPCHTIDVTPFQDHMNFLSVFKHGRRFFLYNIVIKGKRLAEIAFRFLKNIVYVEKNIRPCM